MFRDFNWRLVVTGLLKKSWRCQVLAATCVGLYQVKQGLLLFSSIGFMANSVTFALRPLYESICPGFALSYVGTYVHSGIVYLGIHYVFFRHLLDPYVYMPLPLFGDQLNYRIVVLV